MKTKKVELWYPPYEKQEFTEIEYTKKDDEIHAVEIDLVSVRAADGILVVYDFERDGWVIMQSVGIEHEHWIERPDPEEWREVAFVQAWGLTTEAASG